ncbi:FecR family protein [Flavobacteriaceae bacterium F08102]|nr:FecR family protein [Flavobacteriaceae bacterium F08102]
MTKSITATELTQLSKWVEVKENEQYFLDYLKINYSLDVNLANYDSNKAKIIFSNHIAQAIKRRQKRKRTQFIKYAVAASIALLIATSLYLSSEKTIPLENTVVSTKEPIIKSGTNKAILTLEDGSTIPLEKGKTYDTENIQSNGEKLFYKKNNQQTPSKLAYNYVTIPRGGQFFIELSDNTKVWLNSESKLKYPVNFIEGKPREVELIYGEAYFEVSPSTNHKGARFKVLNQDQNIEVFGTKFNIKAYRNETSIYTTLAEGKISLEVDGKTKFLNPTEQATLNLETNQIHIKSVDIYNETSWKDGLFSFKGKTLLEITRVLTRWYDVEITLPGEKIADEKFNGVLSKNQPLEEILTTIKNTNFINAYEIKNNEIFLK